MFSDADLLGVPVRVIVSPKNLKNGAVEISLRDKSLRESKPIAEAADFLYNLVKTELEKSIATCKRLAYPLSRRILRGYGSNPSVGFAASSPCTQGEPFGRCRATWRHTVQRFPFVHRILYSLFSQ